MHVKMNSHASVETNLIAYKAALKQVLNARRFNSKRYVTVKVVQNNLTH